MACKPVQKLCPNLRISQAVTYTSGVLTVNIPAGDYQNGCVSAAEMQRRSGDSV